MLKFVLGRSGYGKTEYCFSEIGRLVNGGTDNILLITPEQYNFTAEKRLLKMLGESSINKVENSSFSRLNNEVSRLYGGNTLPVLSKGSKAVLMKKAVDSVKDKLLVFNKKTESASFVNSMVRIYDEMKSCNVTFSAMENVSEKIEKEILSRKLKDMSLIISTYEGMIDGLYLDSADELSRLYNKLAETDYLKGRHVFIDGFNGFVANEYKILELIIKDAAVVTITFATDSYGCGDEYNLFAYVNKNIAITEKIAKKSGVPVEFVYLNENFRANNQSIRFLEKNLFSRENDKYNHAPENINLYAAKSIEDECNYVSIQIKKHLRQGIRAKDIAVICRDADKYSAQLLHSFKKYEIPYFDDERQPIKNQPLIVFVKYLLRSVIYSFRSDDILSLAKTGLTDLKTNDISSLENYIYLWSISGVKKWASDFEASTKGFVSDIDENDSEKIKKINASRRYLYDKINRFKLSVKNADALEISRSIYNTLIDFNVNRHLKDIAVSLTECNMQALAGEQERVWDILMQILNRFATVSGDEKITLSDYLSLFNLMVSSEDLGVLPQGLDNVQFGQADRLRADNPKIAFVLGANEGEFPQAVTSGGLLSENDRVILSDNDFKLYSFGETLNLQERYFAYMAVSTASEYLYVLYQSSGSNASPSVIVTSLKDIFPDIKEMKYADIPEIDLVESKASAFELMAEKYGDNTEFSESLKEFFKNDARYHSVKLLAENENVEIQDKALSAELFGRDMYLSASRLEDFFNCRFRYFCKFGLMAKTRDKAQMDAMKTGVVIHYVLENIISEVGSARLGKMSNAEIHVIVDKYLLEYLNTCMGNSSEFTSRFKYQFLRLSKMLYSVVSRLAGEFSQSRFEAKAFELNIDKDGEVKPQVIDLDDGGTVRLRGCVDRVDVLEENGKKYIRVVDYKSGNKKFSLSDIIYGLNLQMFVYLFTLCNDKDGKYSGIPAGVLYMHASRSVLNLGRGSEETEIPREENKEFKMKGLVLYDENNDILNSMEEDLKGKYIPVKMTKSGISGCFASLEELGRICKKVEKLIAQMGNSLHAGEINQNPINGKSHDKTCEFCDYSAVCANRRIVESRDMQELKDDEVIKLLKEE